jgi:hypothetical protein
VPKPGQISTAAFARWVEVLDGGDEALRSIINVGNTIVQYENTILKRAARGAQIRRLKKVW